MSAAMGDWDDQHGTGPRPVRTVEQQADDDCSDFFAHHIPDSLVEALNVVAPYWLRPTQEVWTDQHTARLRKEREEAKAEAQVTAGESRSYFEGEAA